MTQWLFGSKAEPVEDETVVGSIRLEREAVLSETGIYLAVLEAHLDGLRTELLREIHKLREANGLPL